MNKALKGALAATTGGVLLLGGAGTLAYWSDTSTAPQETITSGTLSLVDPTCSWTVAHLGGTAAAFDPTAGRLVPGDVATETCTSTIAATGQNLVATITAAGGADVDGTTLEGVITPVASFTVDGATATQITSVDDGKTLSAKIVLDFPIGTTADNSTNGGITYTVSDYVITATQVLS